MKDNSMAKKSNDGKKVSLLTLFLLVFIFFTFIFVIINLITKNKDDILENFTSKKHQEVIYSNSLGTKKVINNNIDFQSIFVDSINEPSKYVMFNGSYLYYAYEPTKCYSTRIDRLKLEERINSCLEEQKRKCTADKSWREDCKESYCTNYYNNLNDILNSESTMDKRPLCKVFDANDDTSLEELNKKYVIKQNMEGNNVEVLDTFDSKDVTISFAYLTKNNVYYNYTDNDIKKVKAINLNDNTITELNANNLLPYPISINQDIFFQNDNNINLYNEDNKKTKEFTINGDVTNLVKDKYTNNYYNYDSNDKMTNIYENDKLIYKLPDSEVVYSVFATYNYIYVIYLKDQQYEMLMINKEDYQLKEKISLYNLSNINSIKYFNINSNGLVCFIVNNKEVYTYDEDNISFTKIYSSNNSIENFEVYHNYLLYNINDSLYIYNTITNKETIINNVIYNYLNIMEEKLYIVSKESNNWSLNYYSID